MRVLLVGSGFVAPFHLRAWTALPEVEVVGIVSRGETTAHALAQAHGIRAVFSDFGLALRELAPDVVDLCTPVEHHVVQIREAAHRRVHVICQKPLAGSLEEAIAATEAAKRAGIRLMVHENFRFRRWYRAVKRVLDDRAVGRPTYVRSDCRLGGTVQTAAHPDTPWSLRRQPYFAGLERFLLLESMVHQIDVARFLLGEPGSVYARVRRISPYVRGEDLVTIILDFGMLHAVLERSYASKGYPDPPAPSEDLWIEGENGLIRVDRNGKVTLVEDGPAGRREYEIATDSPDPYAASYADTIAHFVDCMRSGRPFETSAEDNLRTLDITFAAYRSAETNTVVHLPSAALLKHHRSIEMEAH